MGSAGLLSTRRSPQSSSSSSVFGKVGDGVSTGSAQSYVGLNVGRVVTGLGVTGAKVKMFRSVGIIVGRDDGGLDGLRVTGFLVGFAVCGLQVVNAMQERPSGQSVSNPEMQGARQFFVTSAQFLPHFSFQVVTSLSAMSEAGKRTLIYIALTQ